MLQKEVRRSWTARPWPVWAVPASGGVQQRVPQTQQSPLPLLLHHSHLRLPSSLASLLVSFSFLSLQILYKWFMLFTVIHLRTVFLISKEINLIPFNFNQIHSSSSYPNWIYVLYYTLLDKLCNCATVHLFIRWSWYCRARSRHVNYTFRRASKAACWPIRVEHRRRDSTHLIHWSQSVCTCRPLQETCKYEPFR